jgi:O-antigen/teichoic acid export membrane protein
MSEPAPHPATPRSGQLGKIALVGSILNSGQWVLNKACTAGATLLLAHWLTPEEFGVAGQATALVQFLTLAVPFALGDVIIAHASRSPTAVATATRLSGQLALLNAVVLLAAIPVCVKVFSDMPSGWLVSLLCIYGLRPLTESLQVPALSRLRLELRYRTIAWIDGASQFAGTICSIVMAAVGFGAASLALPIALAGTSRVWIYRRLSPPDSKASEPDPRIARGLMLEFLPVSAAQYLHKVASSVELLVLGFVSSAFETGLFAFSALLAVQANTVIAHQLGTVLQPVFGRMADDADRQARGLVRTLRVLGLVCVPISLAQAVFAEPAFRVLFAARYQPAVPVFEVLSLVQAFLFVLGPTMACLRAQQQFKAFLVWQFVELTLGCTSCWLAANAWGALGAAAGHGVVWCLGMPVLVWLALRGRSRHAMLKACGVLFVPLAIFVPLFAVAMQCVNWISGWSRHGDAWSLLLLLPASLVVALGMGVLVNRDMRRMARWTVQRLRRTRSEAVP